jgi:hypothetical protein
VLVLFLVLSDWRGNPDRSATRLRERERERWLPSRRSNVSEPLTSWENLKTPNVQTPNKVQIPKLWKRSEWSRDRSLDPACGELVESARDLEPFDSAQGPEPFRLSSRPRARSRGLPNGPVETAAPTTEDGEQIGGAESPMGTSGSTGGCEGASRKAMGRRPKPGRGLIRARASFAAATRRTP